jgi:hypothetical protein
MTAHGGPSAQAEGLTAFYATFMTPNGAYYQNSEVF